jgi:hypothetical protein
MSTITLPKTQLGLYSRSAEYKLGSVEYMSLDGRIVSVTCVCPPEWKDNYRWPDTIEVGWVTSLVLNGDRKKDFRKMTTPTLMSNAHIENGSFTIGEGVTFVGCTFMNCDIVRLDDTPDVFLQCQFYKCRILGNMNQKSNMPAPTYNYFYECEHGEGQREEA